MKKLKLAAIGLIVLGIVFLALGAYYGEGEFYLLLFIPVYKGTGVLALLGGLFIFAGIVAGIVHFFKAYMPQPYKQAPGTTTKQSGGTGGPGGTGAVPPQGPRQGGVVFLGPIPIVWGSDARMTLIAIIIGIIIVVILMVAIFLYLAFNTAFA